MSTAQQRTERVCLAVVGFDAQMPWPQNGWCCEQALTCSQKEAKTGPACAWSALGLSSSPGRALQQARLSGDVSASPKELASALRATQWERFVRARGVGAMKHSNDSTRLITRGALVFEQPPEPRADTQGMEMEHDVSERAVHDHGVRQCPSVGDRVAARPTRPSPHPDAQGSKAWAKSPTPHGQVFLTLL